MKIAKPSPSKVRLGCLEQGSAFLFVPPCEIITQERIYIKGNKQSNLDWHIMSLNGETAYMDGSTCVYPITIEEVTWS